MLKKIDCVMVKVGDLDSARDFYRDQLGLIEHWRQDSSVGMRFPENDAEIVLHTFDLSPRREVNYLVENVERSLQELKTHGVKVVNEPEEIEIGKWAAFEDPFGNVVCILDMTKGPLPTLPQR